MPTIAALLAAVLFSQAGPASTADTMQSDVDRLVRAAEQMTGTWDPRGFATIAEILADRSERPFGQGHPARRWSVHALVRADRYYAAHLLGDLKDPRGVELLIPLLSDPDTDSIVPWALAEIGDRRVIAALIAQLERDDPSARVLAIYALERLNAHEALPKLSELQQDNGKANFGQLTSIAEAAKRAIAMISAQR